MSTNVNNCRYKAVIWGKQDTIFEYFDCAYGDTPNDALKRLKVRYRLDYNAYEYGVIDLTPTTERDRRMSGVSEQPEQTNGTERTSICARFNGANTVLALVALRGFIN